jgi:peptidoglycan/LPS O-acetylase OafA/YrhL
MSSAKPNADGSNLLIDYDGSRRNNFTALRILFSWLVLFGHSFAITGYPELNPVRPFFEGSIWIGGLAVSGFFAISGYLVAASFVRRGLLDYCISRVLRIYPALVVCVLLTVFLLGPWLTSLSTSAYFDDAKTFSYLRNMTSLFPMKFRLPGLFEEHARPAANGSLWTLPIEVSCYILLMIAGAAGLLRSRVLANVTLIVLLMFSVEYFTDIPLIGRRTEWTQPCAYFLLGVGLYINRDLVPLHHPLAIFCAFIAYAALGEVWFKYLFPPAFVYLIFYIAYRSPFIDFDRTAGDPSYGIYIYAWPVQQTIVHFFPDEGPYFNTAVATPIVITLAMISWHFLEKPALSLKRHWLKGGMGS